MNLTKALTIFIGITMISSFAGAVDYQDIFQEISVEDVTGTPDVSMAEEPSGDLNIGGSQQITRIYEYNDTHVPYMVNLTGEGTGEGDLPFRAGSIYIEMSGAGGGGGRGGSSVGGAGGSLRTSMDVSTFHELEITVGERGLSNGVGGWGKSSGGDGGSVETGGGGGSTELWGVDDTGTEMFLGAADAGGGGGDNWASEGGGGGARGGRGGEDAESGEGSGYGGRGSDSGPGGDGGQETAPDHIIGHSTEITGGGSGSNTHGTVTITYYEFSPILTVSATQITPTSSKLQGYLTLEDASTADVYFAYGKVGGTEVQTEQITLDDSGGFSETITDLESLEIYEFRAVGDVNGITHHGNTLYFVPGSISETTQLRRDWNSFHEMNNVAPDADDLVLSGTTQGHRISAPIPLYGDAEDSLIVWNSTEPAGTGVELYTSVTDSHTTAPSTWDTVTSGGTIPGVEGDLMGKYLWTRQVMSTDDAMVTPRLHDLSVAVTLEPMDPIADISTWAIGSSWTYFRHGTITMEGDGDFVDTDMYIEERLTYTVSGIEYVVVDNVTTPVYNVTVDGDVLNGYIGIDTDFGTIGIEITQGYTEGYTLYRVDDQGILVEYRYQYYRGHTDVELIGRVNLFLTMVTTDTHIPNVEEYDYPVETGGHFVANNFVNSMGYTNIRITNMFIDDIEETMEFDDTQNRTIYVNTSEDTVVTWVPAGTFETFEMVQEEVLPNVTNHRTSYYSPYVNNYVREHTSDPMTEMTKVLESYHLPQDPNTLSIEPFRAFVGQTVTVSGSFPEHTSETFQITIPMADFAESVTTDTAGDFTVELEVPYARDNTHSPGKLGSLGVIARPAGDNIPFRVATLYIYDPDTITVEPTNSTVFAGDSETYTATAYHENGTVMGDVSTYFDWSIDRDAGGSWDDNVYTSEFAGLWEVTGEYMGSVHTSWLTVVPGEADRIRIEPEEMSVEGGETVEYNATLTDALGNELEDITAVTNWSIDAAAGGYWEDNVYTSATAGNWTVTGTYMSYTGEATLVVTPTKEVHSIVIEPRNPTVTAGHGISFNATAYDESGNLIEDVTDDTNWTIESSAGGEWDYNTYTSQYAGTWTVTGHYNGFQDTTNLTVTPAMGYRLDIGPLDHTINAGEEIGYNATLYDEFGNEIGDVTGNTAWSIETGAGGTWADNIYTSEIAGVWNITGEHNGVLNITTLTVNPGPAYRIQIYPGDQNISAGSEISYSSTLYDAHGNMLGDVTDDTTWSIETEAGGSWVGNVYTAQFAGLWEVTGVHDEITGLATLTVVPGPMDKISISPSTSTITAGTSRTFTAEGQDEFGNPVGDVTADTEWSIHEDAGGSWDGNRYTSEFAGLWEVTGTYSGIEGTGTLSVNPGTTNRVTISPSGTQVVAAGTNLQFHAQALDAHDNLITDSPEDFMWTNAAEGVFNREVPGDYNVRASYDGRTSPVTTVTVVPGDVDTVEISPSDSISVKAGVEVEFTAVALDAYGNTITTVPEDFTWTGADTGVFSQETAGTYQVTAAYGGVTSPEVTVTVVPGPVDAVTISPGTPQTVMAGVDLVFIAEAADAFGNLITDSPDDFTWSGMDSSGLFNQETVGTYNVTATHGEVTSAHTTVTVVPGELDSVIISPGTPQTVTAGVDLVFTAKAVDIFGNVITGAMDDFTWSGTDTNGLFNKETVGTYDVTASYEGETSSVTTVSVVPGIVYRIGIDPDTNQTMVTGVVLAFTASAYDAFGNLITDTPGDFTWTGADTGLFNVSEPGTYTVSASHGGVTSDTVTVTVTDDRPADTGSSMNLMILFILIIIILAAVAVILLRERKMGMEREEPSEEVEEEPGEEV